MPVPAKGLRPFWVAVLVLIAAPANATVPEPPSVEAEALYLMETRSSQVLASRQADKPVQPASLAKLMTAYVAFQALSEDRIALTDRVRISEAVWRMDGSQMFLEVDEQVAVRKLLAGMVAINGNDAARALAEHIAGSMDTFARMMNHRAETLGMANTVFTNPSGLATPRMHTTAHDMALLARALLERFPQYLDLFNRSEVTHNGITQHNTNRLIRWGRGVDGLMTGRSSQSGHHLVTTAKRKNQDMRLVGALLGAPDADSRFSGMQALLNHGFRFYERMPIYAAGETVRSPQVWQGVRSKVPIGLERELVVTVPSNRRSELTVEANLKTPIRAPVKAEKTLGQLNVGLDGQGLAQRPLVAFREVKAAGWIPYLWDATRLRWHSFWQEQTQEMLANDKPDKGESPTLGGGPKHQG